MILGLIIGLFVVGAFFGLVTLNTTQADFTNLFSVLVDKTLDFASTLSALGRSAIALFQKTTGVVTDIADTVGGWIGSAWDWLTGLF